MGFVNGKARTVHALAAMLRDFHANRPANFRIGYPYATLSHFSGLKYKLDKFLNPHEILYAV